MIIPFSDVNLVAVVIATVACMGFGSVWYGPKLFGDMWIRLEGLDKQKLQSSDMKISMMQGFLATLVANFFLAVILLIADTATIADALKIAAVVWAATALPGTLHDVAWAKKPMNLLYLKASHVLINFCLSAAILQAMR